MDFAKVRFGCLCWHTSRLWITIRLAEALTILQTKAFYFYKYRRYLTWRWYYLTARLASLTRYINCDCTLLQSKTQSHIIFYPYLNNYSSWPLWLSGAATIASMKTLGTMGQFAKIAQLITTINARFILTTSSRNEGWCQLRNGQICSTRANLTQTFHLQHDLIARNNNSGVIYHHMGHYRSSDKVWHGNFSFLNKAVQCLLAYNMQHTTALAVIKA